MSEEVKYIIDSSEENFQEVFSKLMRASYSVYDCVFAEAPRSPELEEIEDWYHMSLEELCTEVFITKVLAGNVICDRKTGNNMGWGDCSIDISAYGVDYVTGGGLNFGWEARPQYDGADYVENTLTVYCFARPDGSLAKSLAEYGFQPEKKY